MASKQVVSALFVLNFCIRTKYLVVSHRQCLVTAGCSDLDHDYASLQDFTQLMRDMKIAGAGQGAGQYDLLEEQQENAYQ